MGVSLKTEQRRSHIAVSSFRPWVRRAEGYRGTSYLQSCRLVPLKPRRPPSLPLICTVFPAISSFSVFRETPMASVIHFKELNCYLIALFLFADEISKIRVKSLGGKGGDRRFLSWKAAQAFEDALARDLQDLFRVLG